MFKPQNEKINLPLSGCSMLRSANPPALLLQTKNKILQQGLTKQILEQNYPI